MWRLSYRSVTTDCYQSRGLKTLEKIISRRHMQADADFCQADLAGQRRHRWRKEGQYLFLPERA